MKREIPVTIIYFAFIAIGIWAIKVMSYALMNEYLNESKGFTLFFVSFATLLASYEGLRRLKKYSALMDTTRLKNFSILALFLVEVQYTAVHFFPY